MDNTLSAPIMEALSVSKKLSIMEQSTREMMALQKMPDLFAEIYPTINRLLGNGVYFHNIDVFSNMVIVWYYTSLEDDRELKYEIIRRRV